MKRFLHPRFWICAAAFASSMVAMGVGIYQHNYYFAAVGLLAGLLAAALYTSTDMNVEQMEIIERTGEEEENVDNDRQRKA